MPPDPGPSILLWSAIISKTQLDKLLSCIPLPIELIYSPKTCINTETCHWLVTLFCYLFSLLSGFYYTREPLSKPLAKYLYLIDPNLWTNILVKYKDFNPYSRPKFFPNQISRHEGVSHKTEKLLLWHINSGWKENKITATILWPTTPTPTPLVGKYVLWCSRSIRIYFAIFWIFRRIRDG